MGWLEVVDKLGHMERHVGEKKRECDVARSCEGLVGLSGTRWHFL